MSKTITLEDAIATGKVSIGQYFLTTAPTDRHVIMTEDETGFDGNPTFKTHAGARRLWRLEEGHEMWGAYPIEGLTLRGKKGFKKAIDVMNRITRELCELPCFERVRSCSLTKEAYIGADEIQEVFREEESRFKSPSDGLLQYWLASRWVGLGDANDYFNIFIMSGSCMSTYNLYRSDGYTDIHTCAVRPSATPSPKLILETEDCDGTRYRPWICLGK